MLTVDQMGDPASPPGATTSSIGPQFVYPVSWLRYDVAPTTMAPPQLAGEARFALLAALPAATTSGTLILCIRLIAFCITAGQLPESHASDRLTTLAGFAFLGTPGMGMPADHITPSAMSEM